MIQINYNNEIYTITDTSRYNERGIGSADYASSINEHVQLLVSVLAACNVECVLEEL